MAAPILYRIHDEHPYLGRDVEHAALALDAAARCVEEVTGIDTETVIEEIGEGGLPWRWEDPETGRNVTLRPEAE